MKIGGRFRLFLGNPVPSSGPVTRNPAAVDLALSTTAPTVSVNGYIYPDADVSDGSWTDELGGTNLFASIDEVAASDSDYIQSSLNPVDDACRIRLSDPGSQVAQPFDVLYRYKKDGTNIINLTVTLLQGASQIAQWTHSNISTSFVDGEHTISGAEFASITDFTDLSVEFMADVP